MKQVREAKKYFHQNLTPGEAAHNCDGSYQTGFPPRGARAGTPQQALLPWDLHQRNELSNYGLENEQG